MSRDYYQVLGVARDAEPQQIKKAYRRLARELHPDVNGTDPAAEEKFKEATEAYEVLGDADKRRLYDTYGHAGVKAGARGAGDPFGGFGGGFGDIFEAFFGTDAFGGGRARNPRGPSRGRDLGVALELDLEEAAFGVRTEVEYDVLDVCRECGGAGTKNPSSVKRCPECGGAGQTRTVRRTAFGQFIQTGVCLRCRGEGELIGDPCPECSGAGRAFREKNLSVEIPAGIADGQRIRLTGQGEAGVHGGPPGDLYVEVSVRPHELFEREGNDILYRQDLTMVQAALGATVSVPTLDGDEEVAFAPGTQPGEIKVLRGRGVPRLNRSGRGDMHVLVNVMIPRDLTDQQKELLRDLEDCCGEEQYTPKGEGIFHRLKQLFAG
jgi:molecular chaperone DnaJ